jgi:DNA-binding CsgD family transcriptional regulator
LVDEIRDVPSPERLAEVVLGAVEPLGLKGAVCGVSGPQPAVAHKFYFLEWPRAWLDTYVGENFVLVDPVPRRLRADPRSFTFRQLLGAVPSGDPGQRVFDASRSHGVKEGLAVPLWLSDGSLSVFSVFGDRDAFARHERAFLEIIAAACLLRAQAFDNGAPAAQLDIGLSRRELDCIALLVRGLTDRDIAARLGITEATVRFHLGRVRRKTGAISRTHLAALAVSLGLARL